MKTASRAAALATCLALCGSFVSEGTLATPTPLRAAQPQQDGTAWPYFQITPLVHLDKRVSIGTRYRFRLDRDHRKLTLSGAKLQPEARIEFKDKLDWWADEGPHLRNFAPLHLIDFSETMVLVCGLDTKTGEAVIQAVVMDHGIRDSDTPSIAGELNLFRSSAIRSMADVAKLGDLPRVAILDPANQQLVTLDLTNGQLSVVVQDEAIRKMRDLGVFSIRDRAEKCTGYCMMACTSLLDYLPAPYPGIAWVFRDVDYDGVFDEIEDITVTRKPK